MIKLSRNVKNSTVKYLMQSVGHKIGSVWFIKKEDGTLRKMAYRLHVRNPKYAKKPVGGCYTLIANNVVRVFDVNKITYNTHNKMNGRGAWRSVPLDNVTRLKVNGEIYKFIN